MDKPMPSFLILLKIFVLSFFIFFNQKITQASDDTPAKKKIFRCIYEFVATRTNALFVKQPLQDFDQQKFQEARNSIQQLKNSDKGEVALINIDLKNDPHFILAALVEYAPWDKVLPNINFTKSFESLSSRDKRALKKLMNRFQKASTKIYQKGKITDRDMEDALLWLLRLHLESSKAPQEIRRQFSFMFKNSDEIRSRAIRRAIIDYFSMQVLLKGFDPTMKNLIATQTTVLHPQNIKNRLRKTAIFMWKTSLSIFSHLDEGVPYFRLKSLDQVDIVERMLNQGAPAVAQEIYKAHPYRVQIGSLTYIFARSMLLYGGYYALNKLTTPLFNSLPERQDAFVAGMQKELLIDSHADLMLIREENKLGKRFSEKERIRRKAFWKQEATKKVNANPKLSDSELTKILQEELNQNLDILNEKLKIPENNNSDLGAGLEEDQDLDQSNDYLKETIKNIIVNNYTVQSDLKVSFIYESMIFDTLEEFLTKKISSTLDEKSYLEQERDLLNSLVQDMNKGSIQEISLLINEKYEIHMINQRTKLKKEITQNIFTNDYTDCSPFMKGLDDYIVAETTLQSINSLIEKSQNGPSQDSKSINLFLNKYLNSYIRTPISLEGLDSKEQDSCKKLQHYINSRPSK